MTSDSRLQVTLKKLPLIEFWCGINKEYLQLSENATKVPLSFLTAYLCEAQFSSYTSTKATYCSRLSAEVDF